MNPVNKRVNHKDRRKLKAYLDGFYNCFPSEKYTIFHFVKFFKQRLKLDKDAWIGVSGATGCLTGNTRLKDCNLTIKELYIKTKGEFFPTKSYDWELNKETDSFSRIVESGNKQTFKIKTKSEKEIIASSDHKFFILEKGKVVEKPLNELNINDVLFGNKFAHPIKSIEIHKEIDTYDLQTPDYHNFILDNDIITHNSGKSRTVLMIQILFGRPFSLIDNVAYVPKGKEIMEMFDKLNFNTLLVDEAAREMRSVNWQSKQQQGVNTKAMTDRFKNNMVFLNMPNFNEFTKSMRQTNLEFRIIIPFRTKNYARVIVQRKNRNWRSDDPWSDGDADKRYERMQKKYGEISNDVILNIERKLPVYVMDFIVPDLEKVLPDVIEGYEKLKKDSREEEEEQAPETQRNKFKVKYEDLFERLTKLLWFNKLGIGTRKITKKEVCEELGVSSDAFNKFLKLPPKRSEETINFRDKIKLEEKEKIALEKQKKKDPLGLLDKKKTGY